MVRAPDDVEGRARVARAAGAQVARAARLEDAVAVVFVHEALAARVVGARVLAAVNVIPAVLSQFCCHVDVARVSVVAWQDFPRCGDATEHSEE